MTLFNNLKIQNKLFLVSGMFIALLIILSLFSGIQLININNNYKDLIESSIGRQNSLSKTMWVMEKIYYINNTKGYMTTIHASEEEIATLHQSYDENFGLLLGSLEEYRGHLYVDRNLNKSEKQERLIIFDGIIDILKNEYQPKIKELDDSLSEDDIQKTYRLIGEAMRIGDRLSDDVDILYEMVSATVTAVSEKTSANALQTEVVMVILAASFIVIALILSVFITKVIKRPITEIENAMNEVSKGNLTYPIHSEYHDELGILTNKIGDMVESISETNKVMTIMDHLDSMVIVTDLDYNLIYVNPSMAEAFGINREDYKGKKCYQALREFNKPCTICQLPMLLPDKDSFPTREYEFLYDDLKKMYIGGMSSIIKWVDGSKVYMQSIKNENELKKNEERLSEALKAAEAANEAKGLFLANMSHEIRTPMNAVIGMAELLLYEKLNKRQRQYTEDIKTSAMALLEIINDILDVSKIQAGKLSLVPEHYDFNLLIDNINSIAQFLADGKNISFKLTMQEQTHFCLFGDDIRLRQVLLNLISNAIKFTDEGYVHLTIEFTDKTIKITVSDSGIGISPENIATIFNPFEQVDLQKNRNVSGTGLGLTITKSIVELMGGYITVDSIYGQGTSFIVEIPKVLGDEELIQRTDSKESALYAPEARILIVDDKETNLNVAAGLLRIFHIQADKAISGEQAIKMVEQTHYDIVFMDHRMPEMSGIETTVAIRKKGFSVPIIALTASAVTGAKQTMMDAGMNDYLSKPIIKAEMVEMLKKWLPAEKLLKPPFDEGDDESADEEHREFWEKVEQIEEISFATGLGIVDGQRDVYEKTLRLMVQEIEKSDANLNGFLANGDMENFRTEVHGIKGSLANIGAMGLSKEALELENAAEKADMDYCREYLPYFLEKINSMKFRLKEAFALIIHAGGPVEMPPELSDIFKRLLGAFEEMDLVLIDKDMANINALDISGGLKEEIEQIKDAVMIMEYDRAAEYIKRLLKAQQ